MKYLLPYLFFLLPCLVATAQTDDDGKPWERFSLSGYGAMNYYHFDWQTDTAKRDAIDNERFILDLGYKWSDKIRFSTEIEFEHGGTGADLEFDRFEEFGEFEFDIAKGGEVLLEQMNLTFTRKPNRSWTIGRVKVPFGLMFERDEPTDYFTAVNSEMETFILPENWTDNGFLLQGKQGRWRYSASFTNGLDGSAFNSANWIKRGNQTRFEMVNAENFALCTRLDYEGPRGLKAGVSLYGSRSTSGNRPKPDLKVTTPIGLAEAHLQYERGPFYLSGLFLYGALGNSEALSNQNRNLSNNLNVKRTPVGAAAVGAFAECGVRVLRRTSSWAPGARATAIVYGRFDYYDTMFRTQGQIFNNPRWQRRSVSLGLVYKMMEDVQIKLQYTLRKVGAPAPTSLNGGTAENTLVAGFAFEF